MPTIYSPGRALNKHLHDARRNRQRMREPRDIEVKYIRGVKSIYHTMQGIVAYGLAPLFRLWEVPPPREDGRRLDVARLDEDDEFDEQKALQELGDWFEEIAAAERAASIVADVASQPMPEVRVLDQGTISRQMDWLELVLGEWMIIEQPHETLIESTGQMLMTHSQREIERVLRIDLRREMPQLLPLIEDWRNSNVNLIETGPWARRMEPQLRATGKLDLISDFVERAHSQGWRVQEMQSWLQGRFRDMPEWRAELLARDQTLKLNGKLNEHRQRAVGIREYEWTTAGDSRVRERHRELDGQIFSWDNPPPAGPHGAAMHPGEDYQDRCQAIPVRPDWMDE